MTRDEIKEIVREVIREELRIDSVVKTYYDRSLTINLELLEESISETLIYGSEIEGLTND